MLRFLEKLNGMMRYVVVIKKLYLCYGYQSNIFPDKQSPTDAVYRNIGAKIYS